MLARKKRKRGDVTTLSQVDSAAVIDALKALGERCPRCQVPERALKTHAEFRSHRLSCFGPRAKSTKCYAGLQCRSMNLEHYRENSHEEIRRHLGFNDTKMLSPSLANPVPGSGFFFDATVSPQPKVDVERLRADPASSGGSGSPIQKVEDEVVLSSVKKERRFASPKTTPKKSSSVKKTMFSPDARQRTMDEFVSPSPRRHPFDSPRRADGDVKILPLAAVQNLSRRWNPSPKSETPKPERLPVVFDAPAPDPKESAPSVGGVERAEVGEAAAAAAVSDVEVPLEGFEDDDFGDGETSETDLAEPLLGEDEDAEHSRRASSGDSMEVKDASDDREMESLPPDDEPEKIEELDVEKEMERFQKIEAGKAQWALVFGKVKAKAEKVAEAKAASRAAITKQLPNGQVRRRPDYKVIRGTRIAVDCFDYGDQHADVDFYFLSHFHSDHYQGLSKDWTKPVYCSRATGNLVERKLRVPKTLIVRLPMDQPHRIERRSGAKTDFTVTLLEANHCPGAVIFLFKFDGGRTVLHTGDFRADPKMESYVFYPDLCNVRIDCVYLDTTYMSGDYDFPSQDDVIAKVCDFGAKQLERQRRTLFICGAYSIGKEKIWLGLAETLNLKVWMDNNRKYSMRCLEDKRIDAVLGRSPTECQVHVLPMGWLNVKKMREYVKSINNCPFKFVVGIKPTGWEYKPGKPIMWKRGEHEDVVLYGVPYSEHSSVSELKRFVRFFQPKSIVATVGYWKERVAYERTALAWAQSAVTPVKAT